MPKQPSNQPYGVEGRFARKTDVEEYVRRVKEKNPNGVVVCIDTEEGTHEKIKNIFENLLDKTEGKLVNKVHKSLEELLKYKYKDFIDILKNE